eukprot:NODE_5598_length_928_cov_76.402484_g5375_i0.p1 GENE.NODE_5598_length_928_cov_76.402484_g5375_i0~~NODE_5598_length_928_cov_76.402484_g5375_i0.p1  ORF type:complete len:260 (+),score=53.58 NODE_5598_length_928_cov_76.402484_g5375_i0:57-782(+)
MPLRSPVKIVCISDTHNQHRKLSVPDADVLIHAGDFTSFGREEHIVDFNDWLGTLPHRHKIVVVGNHEDGGGVKNKVAKIITNATYLNQSSITLEDSGLTIFGTGFFWPMRTPNPNYAQIPADTDIVVTHGPAKGHADGDKGCPVLLKDMERVKPRAVISGHIHFAHGQTQGKDKLFGTTFVNAAICQGEENRVGWDPIVLEFDPSQPAPAPPPSKGPSFYFVVAGLLALGVAIVVRTQRA